MNKRDLIQMDRLKLELELKEYEIKNSEKFLSKISEDAPPPEQRDSVNDEIFYALKEIEFSKLDLKDIQLSIDELNQDY